jgi:hypothetical protein
MRALTVSTIAGAQEAGEKSVRALTTTWSSVLDNRCCRCFRAFTGMFGHWFERLALLVVAINTVVLCLLSLETKQAYPGFYRRLRIVEDLLMTAQVVELGVKMLAYGLAFWRMRRNMVDVAVVGGVALLKAVGETFVKGYFGQSTVAYQDLLAFFRAALTLRFLTLWPPLTVLCRTLGSLWQKLGTYLVMLMCVTYSYSILGVALFGRAAGEAAGLAADKQAHVSFTTFHDAFRRMVQVLIGNNWNDVMYASVGRTSRFHSWFFTSYMLISSMVRRGPSSCPCPCPFR